MLFQRIRPRLIRPWTGKLEIAKVNGSHVHRFSTGTRSCVNTYEGDRASKSGFASYYQSRDSSSVGCSRIAVVDLSSFRCSDHDTNGDERLAAARSLSAAFADTGFAVIVGHGIQERKTDDLRSAAMRFFDMSPEEKRAVNYGGSHGYGSSPYCHMEENGAQLLGDFTRPNDVVESLTYRGLCTENVRQLLPANPPDLATAILAFDRSLTDLRRVLQDASELALGLETGFFGARCDQGNESLRLAHYPDLCTAPLEGQLRYGAHVDSFGITILSLDPENPDGLQVQMGDEWVDVPFVRNSFVLNVGALLSRWTNGVWKASVHRVLLRPGRRLSLVSGGVKPRDDAVVEALGLGPGEAALHPPILARDFLAERLSMHRPSYLQEKQVATDDMQSLSEKIRSYAA